MKKVNSIILRVAGTNCDIETMCALKMAGCDKVDIVHINKIIRKEIHLSNYHILVIPGGFSYGDDISAGKVFTVQLEYKISSEIDDFNKSGRLIIGICNGFQVLVKLGLLPAFNGRKKQDVTLTYNDSGKFECRWVYLKTNRFKNDRKELLWTKNLPEIISLPVAHGEGKFVCRNKDVLDEIEKKKLVIFRYCDKDGNEFPSYPDNPNGSENAIAGIINERGNILGLMPHPERYVLFWQNPLWVRRKGDIKKEPCGDGLKIFINAVEYARKCLV